MTLSPEELFGFDVTGLVVLRGVIDGGLIARARAALERLEGSCSAELPAGCFATWTPVLDEYSILNVLEADPVFLELIDQPAILRWIDALVPAPNRLVEAFTNSRRRGVGLPLHAIPWADYSAKRGMPRSNHLTAFLPLTPIGPDDGPPIVFEGTHKLNVPFPYQRVHPEWPVPDHDREFRDAVLQREQGRIARRWEEIAGYREILVEPGDALVFTEDLVHGAKAIRSAHERRALILGYSPYHFCNWHGVQFSEQLLQRAGPRQRSLLAGPFVGNLYEDGPARHIPVSEFHPAIPHSDRGDRLHDRSKGHARDAGSPDSLPGARMAAGGLGPARAGGEDAGGAIERCLQRAVAHYDADASGALDVAGRVRFETPGAPGWTLEVAAGGRGLSLVTGAGAHADAVVVSTAADLAAVLTGGADPNELFHNGRIRLRGNVALVMQVVSAVSC